MRWFHRIAFAVGIFALTALAMATRFHQGNRSLSQATAPGTTEQQRLSRKARAQKSFLAQHGFNTRLCFLVDMELPSGKSRFFVYDLYKDSILLAGLVAHGCGSGNFSIRPVFSNINGSGCSSLGKYRIGRPYKGQFGLAYKLYGLDSTNDEAFNRNIVLHAYNAVPTSETDPDPICNSRGCPMVSPVFLAKLQPLIDRSPKPILLQIFN